MTTAAPTTPQDEQFIRDINGMMHAMYAGATDYCGGPVTDGKLYSTALCLMLANQAINQCDDPVEQNKRIDCYAALIREMAAGKCTRIIREKLQ